jgi:hypothetical protein
MTATLWLLYSTTQYHRIILPTTCSNSKGDRCKNITLLSCMFTDILFRNTSLSCQDKKTTENVDCLLFPATKHALLTYCFHHTGLSIMAISNAHLGFCQTFVIHFLSHHHWIHDANVFPLKMQTLHRDLQKKQVFIASIQHCITY